MARTDLTFVKATNRGGRLHSAVYNTELVNGSLGYLGDYVAGEREIRNFVKPTEADVRTKKPVIVMKPEIVYDERYKKIGDFINPANKAFPVVPLEELDGFALSDDYFNITTKKAGKQNVIEVGDIFVIDHTANPGLKQLKYYTANGQVLTATNQEIPASANHKFYFKVVAVKDSHVATYMLSNANGQLERFPGPYKMVELTVIETV